MILWKKLARVKHTDSTSWRISGKNYFAWVFVAYGVVLYKIRKRNNHKVGLALFGKKQDGKVLVVDRHLHIGLWHFIVISS